MNIKVKLERFKRGWSQKRLAKESKISVGSICKIENGEEDGIRFGIIKSVAKALDTTVQELFFSEEKN